MSERFYLMSEIIRASWDFCFIQDITGVMYRPENGFTWIGYANDDAYFYANPYILTNFGSVGATAQYELEFEVNLTQADIDTLSGTWRPWCRSLVGHAAMQTWRDPRCSGFAGAIPTYRDRAPKITDLKVKTNGSYGYSTIIYYMGLSYLPELDRIGGLHDLWNNSAAVKASGASAASYTFGAYNFDSEKITQTLANYWLANQDDTYVGQGLSFVPLTNAGAFSGLSPGVWTQKLLRFEELGGAYIEFEPVVDVGSVCGSYNLQFAATGGGGTDVTAIETKLDTANVNLAAVNTKLTASNTKLDTVSADIETKLDAANVNLAAVNTKLTDSNTKLDTVSTDIASVGSGVASTNAALATIDTILSNTESGVTSANSALSDITSNIDSTNSKLDTIIADGDDVEASLLSLAGKIDDSNLALAAIDTTLSNTEAAQMSLENLSDIDMNISNLSVDMANAALTARR